MVLRTGESRPEPPTHRRGGMSHRPSTARRRPRTCSHFFGFSLLVLAVWGLSTLASVVRFHTSADDWRNLQSQQVPWLVGWSSGHPETGGICQAVGASSTMRLWTRHVDRILAASQQPLDPDFYMRDAHAAVLRLLTPRLGRSVRTVEHDFGKLESLVRQTDARYRFLQTSPAAQNATRHPPPPVKILVMGGSVTFGSNCALVSPWKNPRRRECAWPSRLGAILNGMAGGALVQVDSISMGGTNTATGTVMLEYDLMHKEALGHDIVINAYATNDLHVLTMVEASSGNVTLGDRIFEMAQDYVRVALLADEVTEEDSKRSECAPSEKRRPLLLWLDDYLGNEQREIIATTQLSTTVQVLANYYGFSFFSYADTIRDLVYGDTQESLFSPPGWYTPEEGTAMQREIHPQWGMHFSTTLIVMYNLLNLLTTYCSLAQWDVAEYEKTLQYNDHRVPHGLPLFLSEHEAFEVAPRPRPRGLPPRLTPDLRLDDVTDLWRNHTRQMDGPSKPSRNAAAPCSASTNTSAADHAKCPFAWVSGFRPLVKEETILEYFEPVLISSHWDLTDDTGQDTKYGWIPKGTDPMTMEFRFENPVATVTLFMLQSYGEKWENATARVQIETGGTGDREWRPAVTRDLVGFHDKKTSEMYTEKLFLPDAATTLRFDIRLVAGNTFKLMGIALCH